MAAALICLSDSAAAGRVIDRAQREAGWIMIENGFDAEISKVVKAQFNDLVRRLRRKRQIVMVPNTNVVDEQASIIWDDDLLDLIQDLEKHIIEFIVNDLFTWGKAEIKARGNSGKKIPVVTVDMAVASVEDTIVALFSRFWTHVKNHSLINFAHPGQHRAVLYLERLQEDVTLYVTQLIRCWK